MPKTAIDSRKFGELLLEEFPELREDVKDYEGLDHLKMMEFADFTKRACRSNDWKTVERCLRLADRLLCEGDDSINNAVYVSYLEMLPRQGEVRDKLRKMMTTNLRRGWDHILHYLAKLSGAILR